MSPDELANHLLYADDLVLIGCTEADLQAQLDIVSLWADKWRLRFGIGAGKSAVMRFPSCEEAESPFFLQAQRLPFTAAYKYLGVWVAPSLSCTKHLRMQKAKCRRSLFATLSWCHREKLAVTHVVPLVSQYLCPKFLYGVECFPISDRLLQAANAQQAQVGAFITRAKHHAPWVYKWELGWRSWASILIERYCGLLNRLVAAAPDRPCKPPLVIQLADPRSWLSLLLALLGRLPDIPLWASYLSPIWSNPKAVVPLFRPFLLNMDKHMWYGEMLAHSVKHGAPHL